MVQLTAGSDQVVTGELGRENGTHIEVLDLATGKKVVYEKSKLAQIKRDLTDDHAKQAVGLAKFVAWQVGKVAPALEQDGTVIEPR